MSKLATIAFQAIRKEREQFVPTLDRAKNRAQQLYGKSFPCSLGKTKGRRVGDAESRDRAKLDELVARGWKTVTAYDARRTAPRAPETFDEQLEREKNNTGAQPSVCPPVTQEGMDAHSRLGLRDDGTVADK